MESHQITFATGCSGIGAPEMAWGERLGWKPLWCSEIEPFPCAVLKYHWPETPNAGDFLTVAERINSDELEAPDVFIAGTITTKENMVRGDTKLVLTFGIGNGQTAETCDMQEELSQTLNCMHDRQAVMCVPINSMIIGKGVKLTDRQTIGIGENNEPCPTLLSGHGAHAIAVGVENHGQDSRLKECGDLAPTIPGQAGTGGNNVPLCYTVEAELKFGFVRRLTTVECARLQGFPDRHTEIPWRGKAAEKCPRAPQYKAYGNSMCVNVIEWLGRCIEEELNHPEPFEIFYPEQQTFNF